MLKFEIMKTYEIKESKREYVKAFFSTQIFMNDFWLRTIFVLQLVAQILKLDNKYAGEKSMQV